MENTTRRKVMNIDLSLEEIMLLGVLVREGQFSMDEENDWSSDWFGKQDVIELVDKVNYLDDRARDLADKEDRK